MAATPRPYLWKEAQLINNEADETGATFHFYDTNAEIIYPNGNLVYKYSEIPEGHWEEMDLSDEATLESLHYEFLKGDHSATGSLYMVGLRRTASHDTLYLFRYDYMRDMSGLVDSIDITYQDDNPIAQISAAIKNTSDKLFTKDSTLFVPSSRLIVGIAYGNSMINTLVTGYADEVQWKFGRPTVSINGRNTVGYILNGQSFDEKVSFKGTAKEILEQVFERFGITKYAIDDSNSKTIEFEMTANSSGMKALQAVCDLMSDVLADEIWDTEELYDGRIICGFAPFRSDYNPKGNYIFNGKNDVFSTEITRTIDGTYSHVMVTGTNKNGSDLTPVIQSVQSRKFWTPGEHRTYHAARVDGITQEELAKYAQILASQLKEGGQIAKYQTMLRPQLLVGDVAKIQAQGDETEDKLLGIVTQIRHNLGTKGFLTEFTAATGGVIQTISNTKVYSKSKGVNGSNRSRMMSDFISTPTESADIAFSSQPAAPQPKLYERGWAHLDGTGYVNLKINLEGDYEVFVDFELEETSNTSIVGTASGEDYGICLVAKSSGSYRTCIGSNTHYDFSASTSGRHRCRINKNIGTRHIIEFDDSEVTTYNLHSLSTYNMMFLGRCAGDSYFVGSIYKYDLKDNSSGQTLMSLRPYEYVSADGGTRKEGLLDLVSNTFFTCDGMTVGGY